MGALYEDVEKFFGDLFAKYGRFLARYPLVFMLLSLVTSCLLGMGLVSVRYENQVERLYTPMDSQAFKDQRTLAQLFTEDNRHTYYAHQLVYGGTYGEVIVLAAGGTTGAGDSAVVSGPAAVNGPAVVNGPAAVSADGNVLQPAVLSDIWRLYLTIINVSSEDGGFGYEELCARRNNACVVDGLDTLRSLHQASMSVGHSEHRCVPSNLTLHLADDSTSSWSELSDVLGGLTSDNHCLRAQALKLRFNLAHDSEQTRSHSLSWERQFLRALSDLHLPHVDIAFAGSGSLDIELADDLASDTKYFSLTIIIMVIYASFVMSGGDCVSSRMLLAQAGVLAALLAILASFGLLCMCGLLFVDICGVMPFLVLGIGLDDMFIILSGWRSTDLRLSVEDRIAETFRTSAISVTITSLTDLLAFCIGATSPFLSVKNFCVFAGVAVFFCYINQLTFFGGCLVLHSRRVLAARHCLTCLPTSPRESMETGSQIYSKLEILCCSGQTPRERGAEDSLCEKIPHSVLPKLLLRAPTKVLVIALFIVYLGLSIWGASHIKIGIKLKDIVPESSYFSQYLDYRASYFPDKGPAIMFVCQLPASQSYSSAPVQMEIKKTLTLAGASGYVYPYTISWLESFVDYLNNNSALAKSTTPAVTFTTVLQRDFLPQHPQFVNDVKFSDNGQHIIASRFYMFSRVYNDSSKEANMMNSLRFIASNSSLPMLAYSPQFIYFEHYVSILKDTLLAVGVAIIGMLFIALMFIPHPISITCVTITMVTIVLGMFGCMHFWGLELSAITKVQIILSVGFCVDFTVHISHAFMTASGKKRNDRVMSALDKVGIPILNGAFTSILGILMLAFASSYVFKSFFKTMLLVILLGIGHSLLLLPVVLSFIGPKRTAKTVFVPVHHTARSIMGCESSSPPGPQKSLSEMASCGQLRSDEDHHEDRTLSPTSDIELINIHCDLDDMAAQRKALSPVQEEQHTSSNTPSSSTVRFQIAAQDSVDTESFQSLDIMSM